MTRAIVSPQLLQRLYQQAAGEWRPAPATFEAVLETAVARRFRETRVSARDIEAFLTSLHLADVALACACRDGNERAWEWLVREYRPALRSAARTMARDGSAEELADSLFADLFAAGSGRSLLAYYHGRARLGSWLRTVLAQRYVDRYRVARRTVPLHEDVLAGAVTEPAPPDPHHQEYVRLVQGALDDAIKGLAAEDRLRLRLYYGGAMTLAQIGRLAGEHEATVSRKLERARRTLRTAVETRLREQGLTADAIKAAIEAAGSASSLDASRLLAEEPE